MPIGRMVLLNASVFFSASLRLCEIFLRQHTLQTDIPLVSQPKHIYCNPERVAVRFHNVFYFR